MNLVNEKVVHLQFGEGVITEQTGETACVRFPQPYGIKKFIYPDAFVSFLKLSDAKLRKKVAEELRQIRERAAAEREQLDKEDKERQLQLRQLLLEQKRAAAKKSAAVRKSAAKAQTNLSI
jgi:ArsR family metal-binding transcriptional regulator